MACTTPAVTLEDRADITWPRDPRKARIEYLGSVRTVRHRPPENWWATLVLWIKSGRENPEIRRPAGLHVDERGRLFVVDQAAAALYVVAPDGYLAQTIDLRATSGTREPLDVTTDATGTIYVSDPRGVRVLRYTADGRALPPFTHSELRRPTGLVYHSSLDLVFVVDTMGHRLFTIHPSHGLSPAFGGRGLEDRDFNFPVFAAVSPEGDLWVSDAMNFRVTRWGTDGVVQGRFGEHGDGPGSFARPKGVATDAAGHVYVVDALFGNCQIFDSSGLLLLRFGETGGRPGEFVLPGDIAIRGDRIYISDTYNSRIQVFRRLDPVEKIESPLDRRGSGE